jgi:hypothetical protein
LIGGKLFYLDLIPSIGGLLGNKVVFKKSLSLIAAFLVHCVPNGRSLWWGTTMGNAVNQKGSFHSPKIDILRSPPFGLLA